MPIRAKTSQNMTLIFGIDKRQNQNKTNIKKFHEKNITASRGFDITSATSGQNRTIEPDEGIRLR